MTRSVLLTGGTGFVGRQVLRTLVSNGVNVSLVTRSKFSGPSNVKIISTKDLFEEPIEFWKKVCSKHDSVIHLAWYVEPGEYLYSPKNMDCLLGTIRLAQGALEAGVSHFQGVGTCFEYDLSTNTAEEQKPLLPTSRLLPLSPYGIAKASTFLLLKNIFPFESFAWSRLFYLYGEGEDRRRLVPYIKSQLSKGIKAKLTSGLQIRDFMDVEEAGRQIAKVTLTRKSGPLNICSGNEISLRDFASQIAQSYGRPDLISLGSLPDRSDDPHYVVGLPSLK